MLGIIGGLISVFVMMRDLPFAVHGISELSFAGAAGALLIGVNVVVGAVTGSLLAAVVIGALGVRARERNSIIGVLMPFGLGLGVLFLSLYKGRSANKFGLLTGQIVAIDTPQLSWLIAIGLVVLASLFVMWRPLRFASLDPEVAAARGVPVRLLSPIFMLVLGLAIAASVQVVGALLVLSIVCTPAAAAMRVTASPRVTVALSVGFADGRHGRRHAARARQLHSDQPVRHDDLVCLLRRVPTHRIAARMAQKYEARRRRDCRTGS